MSAHITLDHWYAICRRTSTGAMNTLRVDGALYVLSEPNALANGALTGRVHLHVPAHGLTDIGAWKIGADGKVLAMPEPLRTILIQPVPPRPDSDFYVCSDESSEVPI